MRDFFINALEKIIAVIIVLMGLGIVIGSFAVMFFGGGPGGQSGFWPGLFFLVAGTVYLLFVGGLMYLFLGIYQNTKKTAELMERMAPK